MRLIDANALKEEINAFYDNHFKGLVPNELIEYAKAVDNAIDNAPTVESEPYFKKAEKDKRIYESGYKDGQNKRPQDEITDNDIREAIKAGYENGYSMAQAKYQRPQGEWIKDNSGDRFCSECGSCALYHEIGTIFESRFFITVLISMLVMGYGSTYYPSGTRWMLSRYGSRMSRSIISWISTRMSM